jgi:hypothetical protein
MEHYAGIDVSLELSSVCVVDAQGKIVREATVASEPEALLAFFGSLGFAVKRIGLEAGHCRVSMMMMMMMRDAVPDRTNITDAERHVLQDAVP